MENERTAWNRRYRQGSHDKREPDPLLISVYGDLLTVEFPNRGRALDLAGGLGRNAFWLAARGWQVTLVDVSEVAIARAQAEARRRGLEVEFITADLRQFCPGLACYDLMLVFFYLERKLFSLLEHALRPGGFLIYKTYTGLAHRLGKGPSHPMHFLRSNELLHAFPKLQVLYYRETIHARGIAELVARRPHLAGRVTPDT